MGFFASKALLSAVELGVFKTLGGGPMSGESLRQQLGLHPRSTADFLDSLVALGFLLREGDGAAASYANRPRRRPFSIGEARAAVAKNHAEFRFAPETV